MSRTHLSAFMIAASIATLLPHVAYAQDPASPALPSPHAVPVGPSAAVTPPPLVPLTAEAQIVKARGGYACAVTDRGGVDENDLRTTAEIVCQELAKQKAPVGRYTIRFGRLGSRTRLVVANDADEREVWLGGIDEVAVATPRVVAALVQHKTLADTEGVNSVLALEATTPRNKPGQLSLALTLFGATTAFASTGVSSGVGLGFNYRTPRFGVFTEGRLGGIGSASKKLVEASLGIGGHAYLNEEDLSPFAGGGFQVVSYSIAGESTQASGIGTFAEIGIAGFRTNKVGVAASVRAAFPLFEFNNSRGYVVPLTLNVGISFH